MATYSLLDLQSQVRAIGRAAVFYGTGPYAYVASPTGADLSLTHLGDTEGEITIEWGEEYTGMTTPELTGGALHNRYVAGENPRVTIPLYVADPDLLAIISPTGSASGGYQRRRAVTNRVLVLIPEEVFIESNAQVDLVATNTAGTMAWTIGGDAATPTQLDLLRQSIWFWGGHFEKPGAAFRHEDGGKAVQPVVYQSILNTAMPDGHMLYTRGLPEEADTPILVDAA